MKYSLALGMVAVLAVAACSSPKQNHYWQRTDPNSALYLTGVKAQQTLEQDIASCVHNIIELTQLADVRNNVPAISPTLGNYDQAKATRELQGLPRWDVPEYIRDLRVDHTNYHDFDGCMRYMGWQRVSYVGPEEMFRSKEIYDDTGNYSVRPQGLHQDSVNKQMQDLHKPR